MKVITSAVNNPTMIELQYLSLKKYLKNDFEYIVFNDGKNYEDPSNDGDLTQRQQIFDICEKLNVKCIPTNNENLSQYRHHVSSCLVLSLKEMLKYQLENPDFYIILDSDMFLIDYLDINNFMKYKAAFFLQTRPEHSLNWVWSGVCFLNMNHPSEFDYNEINWDFVPNSDVGGATYTWLMKQLLPNEKLPTLSELRLNSDIDVNTKNIFFFKLLHVLNWNENDMPDNVKSKEAFANFIKTDPRNDSNGNFYSELYHNCFYHYKAGGNWDGFGVKLHLERIKKLKDIILSM